MKPYQKVGQISLSIAKKIKTEGNQVFFSFPERYYISQLENQKNPIFQLSNMSS